jgi:hypothetical protein
LEWFLTESPDRRKELRSGMSPGREAAILATWRLKQGSAQTP